MQTDHSLPSLRWETHGHAPSANRWILGIHRRICRVLVLASATSALLACGGGGGGSEAGGVAPPPVTGGTGTNATVGMTLTGSVVKGPVAGATVQALCHDKNPPELVGSTQSSATATYQLTASRVCTAVLELQVSNGTYVDEVTGQTITGSAAPWMRSLVDASSDATTGRTVVITPLTNLLHAKAVAADGSVSVARLSEVAQQLKADLKLFTGSEMDPVTTVPSMGQSVVTESGAAYSVILAAISKLSNGSADGIAAAVEDLRVNGFGKNSPLSDAMRFAAASGDILGRIGLDQNTAGKLVIRAESFVATEALSPLTVVPDSSGLSCEPLKVQDELTKLANAHSAKTSAYIYSWLSMVLSTDSYVKALETWKARCSGISDVLDIMISAEKMGADANYAEFLANKKPLKKCAFGVVADIIVRGTGQTICVLGDGTNGTDAFILSSVDPEPADSSISIERCIELSSAASTSTSPLTPQYAVFELRGTPYMFCGSTGALNTYGFSAWLNRQNIGYYPDPVKPVGSGTDPTTGGSELPNYGALVQQNSRLFTGKSFDVRLATDSLDRLFPSGIAAGMEPSWPGIKFGSVVSNISCVNFGLGEYIDYLGRLQNAKNSFQASDYEAVGRRGYAGKMVLAIDNLVYWYDIRSKVDPVNNPSLVCFRN